MTASDSEATFEKHCNRIDESGMLLGIFRTQGLTNLSAVAFAIGTPQSPPSEDAFKEFATGVNGGTEPSTRFLAFMRRLHFEACTTVMSELKARTTADTIGEAKKLPVVEKAARHREQEQRLVGLRLKGELQPSYALVDLVANMKETDSVVWIAPSKCSKRDSEIQNTMKENL